MNWKNELKNNITTVEELGKYIFLSEEEAEKLREVISIHPMSITRYYLSLIDKENPMDPLRKMMIPSVNELIADGSYDTSGEASNTKMSGLQHKYAQTALVLSTNVCAAYCRFCFRKRLVGLPNEEVVSMFRDAAEYIRNHREITNVLISGGDSMMCDTPVIRSFLEELKGIDHLEFIRFGTRVPVVYPRRIIEDTELLDMLEEYSDNHHRVYVVTHFNHPNEITSESEAACAAFRKRGITVSNQAVLFKDVNDSPETLAALMSGLIRIGVNPYYVFQCRPVARVKSHFQLPLKKGYEIIEKAKTLLNGHGKRFRYIMSHCTGKIEIVGIMDDEIYFKYHQAKNPEDVGRFFKRKLKDTAAWLDELEKD